MACASPSPSSFAPAHLTVRFGHVALGPLSMRDCRHMPIAPVLHNTHAALCIRAFGPDGRSVADNVLCPLPHLSLSTMTDIVHGDAIEGLTDRFEDTPGNITMEVMYGPDEPDLPGLLYRAERAGRGEWFLVADPDGAEHLNEWASDGRPFPPGWLEQLDDAPTDGSLVVSWGRALSPRMLLRGVLLADDEAVSATTLGPGQVAVVVRSDRLSAAEFENDDEAFAALLAPFIAPERLGYAPLLARAIGYDGDDGWRSWAGPAARTIETGTIALLHATDPARIDAAIQTAAQRSSATPIAEPAVPEGFTRAEDLPAEIATPEVVDSHDPRRWFASDHGGHFWVRASEVASLAAGRALTIADAAAILVVERNQLVNIGLQVAREFTERTGDPAHLLDHDRLQLRIGDIGVAQMGLIQLSRKRPPEGIVEDAVRMHADTSAIRTRTGVDMSGRWFALQPRPRDWAQQKTFSAGNPLMYRRDITDDAGQDTITLVATLEDEHSLMYLTRSLWETLPAECRDHDIDALCERDLPRVRFEANVSAVADRPPHGPMCVIAGSNISSALVNDRLLAGFVAALAAVGHTLNGPLVAYAGYTDLVLIGVRTDDMTHRLDVGNSEADAHGWRKGLPLRYVRMVDALPEPAGTFSLNAR